MTKQRLLVWPRDFPPPLEIKPRLRRLCGYRALPQLRIALKTAVMEGKEVRAA